MHAEPFPLTLARLHLHAVLPVLEDLAALSPEARAIAAKWNFSLRLQVAGRGGPSATLVSPGDGRLLVHPQSAEPVKLVLTFLSANQLNRTFLDQKTLPPLPTGGFWRVLGVTPFTRLAKLLNAALQPAPGVLERDPAFREQHLRLLFRVLLGAVPVVAEADAVSRRTLSHTPDGLAEIRAPALELCGWVRWARGRLTAAPGPAPGAPDATVTFTDLATTDAALLGNLDPNAAVGLGKVAIAGLVPLADGLSLVMDRVETFLKPAGAATMPGNPTISFSGAAG